MDNDPSGWAIGWTAFAGIMMVMGGVWWIISGIVAIANEDFYVVGEEYIFQFSTTTWGWIHLILGIVILLAGFYLFTGAVWARTVGVIIAVLWALVAFALAAETTVWITGGLAVLVKAPLPEIRLGVVLLDPGNDVLGVERDRCPKVSAHIEQCSAQKRDGLVEQCL